MVLRFNIGGQFAAGFLIEFIRRQFDPCIVPLFSVLMYAIVFCLAAFIPSASTLDVTWVIA